MFKNNSKFEANFEPEVPNFVVYRLLIFIFNMVTICFYKQFSPFKASEFEKLILFVFLCENSV